MESTSSLSRLQVDEHCPPKDDASPPRTASETPYRVVHLQPNVHLQYSEAQGPDAQGYDRPVPEGCMEPLTSLVPEPTNDHPDAVNKGRGAVPSQGEVCQELHPVYPADGCPLSSAGSTTADVEEALPDEPAPSTTARPTAQDTPPDGSVSSETVDPLGAPLAPRGPLTPSGTSRVSLDLLGDEVPCQAPPRPPSPPAPPAPPPPPPIARLDLSPSGERLAPEYSEEAEAEEGSRTVTSQQQPISPRSTGDLSDHAEGEVSRAASCSPRRQRAEELVDESAGSFGSAAETSSSPGEYPPQARLSPLRDPPPYPSHQLHKTQDPASELLTAINGNAELAGPASLEPAWPVSLDLSKSLFAEPSATHPDLLGISKSEAAPPHPLPLLGAPDVADALLLLLSSAPLMPVTALWNATYLLSQACLRASPCTAGEAISPEASASPAGGSGGCSAGSPGDFLELSSDQRSLFQVSQPVPC